jgi:transcriptional regulator with XRE-family HTH domain
MVRLRRGTDVDATFNLMLGERLRRLRYQHKLLLQDIDDMTGMRYDLLSRIERGETRISVFELMSLASIYEISVEKLLEGLWDYLEFSE